MLDYYLSASSVGSRSRHRHRWCGDLRICRTITWTIKSQHVAALRALVSRAGGMRWRS